jgi:predicted kinase
MKPRLILIGGEAWTGKTTCARILFESLDNCAWLDGDDVWRVNPWSLDDPRLRTSDVNMAFVLQTYLRSGFDFVILSSIVLSDPAIKDRILGMIDGVDYEMVWFTLFCDESALRARALQRDAAADPEFLLLAQSRTIVGTIHIDTTGREPAAIAAQLRAALYTCSA